MIITIYHSSPGYNYTDVWVTCDARGNRGPIRTHGARWRPRLNRSRRKISGYSPIGAIIQSVRSL